MGRCYDRSMLLQTATRTETPPSRFAWLMGMHAENHHRLDRMFAPQRLVPGVYVSSVGDRLDLVLQVLEHHPYTVDLSLSYLMTDEQTGLRQPGARIRMYRDARVAEVLSNCEDAPLQDLVSRLLPPRTVFDKRLRSSSFLNRWLEYLAEQGHSIGTLQRLPHVPSPAAPALA